VAEPKILDYEGNIHML